MFSMSSCKFICSNNYGINLKMANAVLTRSFVQRNILKYLSSNPTTHPVDEKKKSKDDILPDYINRNPRNLEMLRIARQPKGHYLDQSFINYWYCLELNTSGRYAVGTVRHNSGKTVIQASTSEMALQKRLPSVNDLNSVGAIADVLAKRCLEAGITEMSYKQESQNLSSKAEYFLSSMKAGGIKLTEDFQIHEQDMYPWARENPTIPTDVPEDDLIVKGKL